MNMLFQVDSIGLAAEGKKVLVVDTDPQGSLTIALGYPRPDELPITLTDMMQKVMLEETIAPGEGIIHHSEGVDLMPANISLSGLEVSLVNAMSRESILKQYLDTVNKQYDYILLDCMPSLGMLTINALTASDNVVIPVQAAYLPAKGLEQLLMTVNKVKKTTAKQEGYLGFDKEKIEKDNITLIFKLYDNVSSKIDRTALEKELIDTKKPRMQSGIKDRVKPIEDMIDELTNFLND